MWDDIYNEIDENIHPCKGCEDYVNGECISKGGCGEERARRMLADMRGEE